MNFPTLLAVLGCAFLSLAPAHTPPPAPPAYRVVSVNPGRFGIVPGTLSDRDLYQSGMIVARSGGAPVPDYLRFYDPNSTWECWVYIGLTGLSPNGDVNITTALTRVYLWPAGVSKLQVCSGQLPTGLRSKPVDVVMLP